MVHSMCTHRTQDIQQQYGIVYTLVEVVRVNGVEQKQTKQWNVSAASVGDIPQNMFIRVFQKLTGTITQPTHKQAISFISGSLLNNQFS